MDSVNAARVNPDKLLARSERRQRRQAIGIGGSAARAVAGGLLKRMTIGRLTIVDHSTGTTTTYGPGPAPTTTDPGRDAQRDGDWGPAMAAVIEIHDARAWSTVMTEGSIGLGRGYIERWWTSPDPVAVVRLMIANIGPVDEIRNRLSRMAGPATDQIRRILPRSNQRRNKEEISAHYDLGNEFFTQFLDETLTYSSGVFPEPTADLAMASTHKYDMLIDSLELDSSHHLLEIGTGWGGMAIRAAERTGCRVTTTTISEEQLVMARRRVDEAGLADRVDVIDRDWRDLTLQADRVVSIEMIEAVDWRDYRRFFATIERCIKPDGRAVLQAICVPDRRYHRTKNTEDFIRRFVFPGGYLPSIGSMVDAVSRATRLQVVGINDFSSHYAETLRQWQERFEGRRDQIVDLGLDERFIRLWQFYLVYCRAAFLERHCTVSHLALVGPDWRPTLRTVPSVVG